MESHATRIASSDGRYRLVTALPAVVGLVAFFLLFAKPAILLGQDWWTNPEAGHGLLLAPVALWLAWRRGLRTDRLPDYLLGTGLLLGSVTLRLAADLAAELYTMRLSMIGAIVGLVVFYAGLRQALSWWLPFLLLALSVPFPEVVTSALALPLQFKASQMGAYLLEWREVPVSLSGNIISLPSQQLFVTEACSGLRSLTALLSLGVLMGGLWLRYVPTRILLLAVTIPIAIVINGIRVFLTGFLVYYVDPSLGDGFMHLTEGWLMFVVSFGLIGGVAWVMRGTEHWVRQGRDVAP